MYGTEIMPLDIDYDHIFINDLEDFKESVSEHLQDSGMYCMFTDEGVVATYEGDDGIYFDLETEETFFAYEKILDFAKKHDLTYYEGATFRLFDLTIREHTSGKQEADYAADLFFKRMEGDGVEGDIYYIDLPVPFYGDYFLAAKKTEDSFYMFNSYLEKGVFNKVKESAEKSGYTLKAGIPSAIRSLIAKIWRSKDEELPPEILSLDLGF